MFRQLAIFIWIEIAISAFAFDLRADETRFLACEKAALQKTAGSRIRAERADCDRRDTALDSPLPSTGTTSLLDLSQDARRISKLLVGTGERIKFELNASLELTNTLEKEVLNHLDASIEKYGRWSKCDSQCASELNPILNSLPQMLAELRTELALMKPDNVTPVAMGSTQGWIASQPRHPFKNAPRIEPSSNRERELHAREFLNRMAKKRPAVASRIEALLDRKEVLQGTPTEDRETLKAMVEIRAEARDRYLALVSKNPLLIFLEKTDGRLPLSTRDIAVAASKLHREIADEKMRLAARPNGAERAHAFIEYRPLVEKVLAESPHLCSTAEKIAAAEEKARQSRRFAIALGQIGIGVFAAATCSTLVACSLGGAALAAGDYAIASHDATVAFKKGIANVSASETVARQNVHEAGMAPADTAARMEGLSLALGAPTMLKGTTDVVRASSSLLRSTRVSREVVGAASTPNATAEMRSVTNPILHTYYAKILKDHEGREREILEILIARMNEKGYSPAKISSFMKDRVRQCVR